MDIVVLIYPNTGEDWVVNPPISGYPLITGQQGYCLSVAPILVISHCYVPGALLNISEIESHVELVENISFDSKDSKIDGVGGIATEIESTITINNLTGSVNIYGLLGRQVKICRMTGQWNISATTTRFTGYINSIEPSNNGDILNFRCKGSLGRLLSKEVGEVVGFDGESIAPICYGIFNKDLTTLAPVTQTTNLSVNDISVGQNTVGQVGNLFVWDEGLQDYHSLKTPLNLLDVDKVSLGNLSPIPLYLQTGINNTTEDIYIYCPPIRVFSSSANLTGLSIGDVYRMTDASDPDRPSGLVLCTLMDIREGNYLLFTTFDHEDFVPTTTGLMVKHSGSGPSTIVWNYRSDTIYRSITPDSEDGTWIAGVVDRATTYAGYTRSVSAKPKSIRIKVDNEILHLNLMVEEEMATDNDGYIYYVRTKYRARRGVSGTTPSGHSTNAVIYNFFSEDNSREEIMKDPLSYNQSLLFRANVPLYEFSGMYFTKRHFDALSGTESPTMARTIISNSLNPQGSGSLVIEWTPDVAHTLSGMNSNLVIDLSFKNSSISGVVSNVYLMGSYGLSQSGESGSTSWVSYLEISRGGAAYDQGAGSWHTRCKELNIPFYVPYVTPGTVPSGGLSVHNWLALSRVPIIIDNTTKFHDHSYDSSSGELYGLSPFMNVFKPDDYPYMFGSMDNLSNIGSTRYFLMLKTSVSNSYTYTTTDYHRTTLNINNLSLAVDFFLDITNTQLLRSGSGMVAAHLNMAAFTASDILKDLFEVVLGSGSGSVIDKTYFDYYNLANLIISGKARAIKDEIVKFSKNNGICISQDYLGKIILSSVDTDSSIITTELTDSSIIGYTQEYADTKSLATEVLVRYNKDFSSEKFKASSLRTNSDALLYTNNVPQKLSIEAGAIISSDGISSFIGKAERYLCKPRRKLIVTVKQPDLPYVIGDWVTINSSVIRSTTGFVYKVIGVSDDLLKGEFTLTLIELPDGTEDLAFHETINSSLETFEEVPESALETFEEVINV